MERRESVRSLESLRGNSYERVWPQRPLNRTVASIGHAKIKRKWKNQGGEENTTSIKRRLRLSKKQRESSSLRPAPRLNAILAQVADDKAF